MRALGAVLLFAVATAVAAQGEDDPWAKILASRVSQSGEVAYRTLAQEDGRLLRRVLDRMSAVDVGALDHDHAVAFWINSYHATVVAAVLHGEAPETLAGRARMYHWFREKVGGKRRTLDEILDILNGYAAADPRIHLAISNGTRGGPRLPPVPYAPELLDAQLSTAARRFVNDIDRNYVDSIQRCLALSRVFNWYQADFEAAAGTLLQYLRALAERRDLVAALEPEHVEIRYLPFDWRLNAAPGERIQ